MNNKTKGTIAGAAAIALLAGGTTFALWSDQAPVDGGIITSGNLDVASTGTTWVDLSSDRTDVGENKKGHSIDLAKFKIVPGDTIQGTFGIAAALEGDNLVANLGLTLAGAPAGDLLADAKGVTVTYSLVNADGSPVAGATDRPLSTTPTTVAFTSTDNVNNVAKLPTLPATVADTNPAANLNVVVTAKFDTDTDKRTRVQATADLQKLGVSLEQTRKAGVGGGF